MSDWSTSADPDVSLVAVEGRHVPTILDWFEAAHIRRWWGDPRVNASELIWHRKAGGASGCRVICAGGTPVGYLQWTELGRYFGEAPFGLPDDGVDIDILIGAAEMTGRGVGSRALRLAVKAICAAASPPLLSLVTATENARAIAVYEKIGFTRHKIVDDPIAGDALVMTFKPGV
ncbi:MAG: acetyltransferase [Alphaproteobacteria bacterium]|nr:acetyltransferase [Alphaproteobacteria bacterium]